MKKIFKSNFQPKYGYFGHALCTLCTELVPRPQGPCKGPAFSGENFAKYPEKSLRKKKKKISRRVTKKKFFFLTFAGGPGPPGCWGPVGNLVEGALLDHEGTRVGPREAVWGNEGEARAPHGLPRAHTGPRGSNRAPEQCYQRDKSRATRDKPPATARQNELSQKSKIFFFHFETLFFFFLLGKIAFFPGT